MKVAPLKVAIGLGMTEFPFADAPEFWRWVDLCEHGGIDSLWQTDRIVSSTPILECMSVMAALAGRTRRLKFGVNVVSLAMRDPVLLAKQCATIDMLSEGRLLPGFGIGSPRAPEWETLHLDSTTRGRKTDEALEIIAALWTGNPVTYQGRHFKLTNAQIAPKPVQPDLPSRKTRQAGRQSADEPLGQEVASEQPNFNPMTGSAQASAPAAPHPTMQGEHRVDRAAPAHTRELMGEVARSE